MILENRSTQIKRMIMSSLLKLFYENKLLTEIDKLPIQLYPKDQASLRCCIYKDRAVTRYRIIGTLGISIENETDETIPLSHYAKAALEREKVKEPVLTFIDDACSSCVKAHYFVTNICKGCLARPCSVNCPKKAITVVKGHAHIDPDKCINCGICKTVCPYSAITKVTVPCEESCPTGAISKDKNNRQSIDYTKCIYCGKCTRGCPFGAIVQKTQIIDVAKNLKNKKNVIAMIAPSIAGQFNGNVGKIISALKQIGFTKVYEVAIGAEITAKNEAHEFLENKNGMLGTSCCPAYTESVKKHARSFQKFVSKSKTPMSYTAEIVTNENKDSIKVFIGPCLAKKYEGIYDDNIDYVLTYEELGSFFTALNIDLNNLNESKFDSPAANKYSKNFPVSTGVSEAVKHYLDGKSTISVIYIDGLTKDGIKQLQSYGETPVPNTLIEVMSCPGGCIAGPGVMNNPKVGKTKLRKYVDASEN